MIKNMEAMEEKDDQDFNEDSVTQTKEPEEPEEQKTSKTPKKVTFQSQADIKQMSSSGFVDMGAMSFYPLATGTKIFKAKNLQDASMPISKHSLVYTKSFFK